MSVTYSERYRERYRSFSEIFRSLSVPVGTWVSLRACDGETINNIHTFKSYEEALVSDGSYTISGRALDPFWIIEVVLPDHDVGYKRIAKYYQEKKERKEREEIELKELDRKNPKVCHTRFRRKEVIKSIVFICLVTLTITLVSYFGNS
jgi:hypothetical protein